MTEVDEGGLRPQRGGYIRESTYGEVPTDPDWNSYSDAIQRVTMTPDANTARQDATGDPRAQGFFANSETHELTVAYHLQNWLVTVNFTDPTSTSVGSTTLGVASDTSGDTSIDVTIYNDDETKQETITTDGSDGTTFVTGSTSFDTIGRVTLSTAASGTITVSEDSSGSAGTSFGSIAAGDTDVEDADPLDAAGDGILRNRDNSLRNHHACLFREEHTTDAGADNAGRRIYYVVKGAKIDQVDIPFTTDRSLPIEAELTYMAKKIRPYTISQPSSPTTLQVESTSTQDTSQTLTVEDEGAGTTDTFTLNGQTQVSGNSGSTFADIDAAELDAETKGNVLIKDGSGTTLMTIDGQDAYEHNEGDLGVPTLGAGSQPGTIGTAYEIFSGDTLQATGSSTLGGSGSRIISGALTVSNNVDNDAQEGTPQRYYFAEAQNLEVGAEVAGPVANAETIRQQLQSVSFDVEWVADGGTVTFEDGKNMDPGDVTKEANAARDTMDSTFEFAGINFS